MAIDQVGVAVGELVGIWGQHVEAGEVRLRVGVAQQHEQLIPLGVQSRLQWAPAVDPTRPAKQDAVGDERAELAIEGAGSDARPGQQRRVVDRVAICEQLKQAHDGRILDRVDGKWGGPGAQYGILINTAHRANGDPYGIYEHAVLLATGGVAWVWPVTRVNSDGRRPGAGRGGWWKRRPAGEDPSAGSRRCAESGRLGLRVDFVAVLGHRRAQVVVVDQLEDAKPPGGL